jgi:hypothetical protein
LKMTVSKKSFFTKSLGALRGASAGASLPARVALGALTAFAFTFFLFQKKLLPLPVSKFVSKIFFYPTFPLTLLNRIGNYYTRVDDTLYLGCAPMSLLGIPSLIYNKIGVRGVVNVSLPLL